MKHFTIGARHTPLPLLVAALCLSCAGAVSAQHPKVTSLNGHVSPLMARLTDTGGKTRDVMITFNFQGGPYQYRGLSDSGGDVKLWLDTISSIKDPDEEGVTATLKNGTERHLAWHGAKDEQTFQLTSEDGGTEDVDIRKLKNIQFLKPARKDRQGNAMFNDWKYSPFTGEKLAKK